jgi:hypothetical protein
VAFFIAREFPVAFAVAKLAFELLCVLPGVEYRPARR